MSSLKQRISSPLEAGTSILETQTLPSHITQALEYASKRLARKALHITLVVVRKEYQLPSSTPPCATPTSSVSTPASPEFLPGPISPSRFISPLRSRFRRGTNSSVCSTSTTSTATSESSYSSRIQCTSTAFSPLPTECLFSPPMTPRTPASVATNSTVSSTGSNASAGGPNPFGMRLIYASSLSARDEKILRSTIARAERKFQKGTGWLPPPSTASACGLNSDLIRHSIRQNEVLFSSEGLSLLGLDRLYTFKSALAAYARTTLPSSALASPISDSTRIEDAVDELRRLVLANGGRPINKADLHRSYEWIGVSASALGDVERMYRRAYGGIERSGALEVTAEEAEREPNAVIKIGLPPTPRNKTPVAKTPLLKLQTTFDNSEATKSTKVQPEAVEASSIEKPDEDVIEIKLDDLRMQTTNGFTFDFNNNEEEHDGDITARPIPGQPFWNDLSASIDEMLYQEETRSPLVSRFSTTRESRVSIQRLNTSHRLGPMTPNGYEDISPVTRGEWGFLFTGDSWKGIKMAAVETC